MVKVFIKVSPLVDFPAAPDVEKIREESVAAMERAQSAIADKVQFQHRKQVANVQSRNKVLALELKSTQGALAMKDKLHNEAKMQMREELAQKDKEMAKMVEELSKRQSLKGQRWLLSRAAGSFFHCESSSALAFLGHIKTAVASFLARRWERASELERKAMTAALSAMVEECKVAFPSPALHTQAGVAISGFRTCGIEKGGK